MAVCACVANISVRVILNLYERIVRRSLCIVAVLDSLRQAVELPSANHSGRAPCECSWSARDGWLPCGRRGARAVPGINLNVRGTFGKDHNLTTRQYQESVLIAAFGRSTGGRLDLGQHGSAELKKARRCLIESRTCREKNMTVREKRCGPVGNGRLPWTVNQCRHAPTRWLALHERQRMPEWRVQLRQYRGDNLRCADLHRLGLNPHSAG
jgi:hypothetical protein